jgi:1-acyl-sn-glycerol-3-phosphate acyltransferase
MILRITCRIDIKELQSIPKQGPYILVINHLSVIEGPMMYLFLRPRNTIALAKKELWEHAFTRKIMQWWECIPIDRGSLDREALKACFDVLDRKDILCIAPEGTRSPDNTLIQGKAGTSFIASKSRAPILPVVNWGIEDYTKNLKRFKRTKVHFKVGTPFVISSEQKRFTGEQRQQITDEMMIRIAEILPESYRGFYTDRVNEPRVFTKDVSLEELESGQQKTLPASP